jgi:hypothetical protein
MRKECLSLVTGFKRTVLGGRWAQARKSGKSNVEQ